MKFVKKIDSRYLCQTNPLANYATIREDAINMVSRLAFSLKTESMKCISKEILCYKSKRTMKAICKVCNLKGACPYIKKGRVDDCIDVQNTYYGYQDAIEKACKVLEELLPNDGNIWSVEAFIKSFRRAMEG